MPEWLIPSILVAITVVVVTALWIRDETGREPRRSTKQ